MEGGIAPREITDEQVLPIQKSIVRLMMCLEDGYRDLVFASHKEKVFYYYYYYYYCFVF